MELWWIARYYHNFHSAVYITNEEISLLQPLYCKTEPGAALLFDQRNLPTRVEKRLVFEDNSPVLAINNTKQPL